MSVQSASLQIRCSQFLVVGGSALVVAAFLFAFLYAPLVKGVPVEQSAVIGGTTIANKLLFSQKIFYFHVPVALVGFIMLGVSAYFGVRFLMTKNAQYDLKAHAAMCVTLVFMSATLISGDLWTRFEWGVWWVWEPRLTTYFILTLLVLAYFVLRNSIDDPERCAALSSVFGIIAFLNAPISFAITRLVPSSIHPVVFRAQETGGLPPDMLAPFLLALFGMLCLAAGLYQLDKKSRELRERTESLKKQLEAALAAQHR